MKRKTIITAAISVLALGAVATVALAQDTQMPRNNDCPRSKMMDGKYGGRSAMMQGGGFGLMGGHHMGRFMKNGNYDLKLTPERVKEIMEGRIAWMGNENLKVGKVITDKDGKIQAQLVTKDNSLVDTFSVDPKTGAQTPVR